MVSGCERWGATCSTCQAGDKAPRGNLGRMGPLGLSKKNCSLLSPDLRLTGKCWGPETHCVQP